MPTPCQSSGATPCFAAQRDNHIQRDCFDRSHDHRRENSSSHLRQGHPCLVQRASTVMERRQRMRGKNIYVIGSILTPVTRTRYTETKGLNSNPPSGKICFKPLAYTKPTLELRVIILPDLERPSTSTCVRYSEMFRLSFHIYSMKTLSLLQSTL